MVASAPKFIGLSTGRAGSLWISQVMLRSGIACTHEHVYIAPNFGVNHDTPPEWNLPQLGEWSAQIVPLVDKLYDSVKLWQVRDPINVVASLMAFRLFHKPYGHGAQGDFIRSHISLTGEPLRDCIRYVNTWMGICDAVSDISWRVEDVDADMIISIGSSLGVTVNHYQAQAAIDAIPTTLNRKETPRVIPLKLLPDTVETQRLLAWRERFHYAQ